MAEARAVAEKAFDFFLEAYGPKYDKAVACLAKDRDVLLAFYDFPAEHWKHIRTTNPIESTFATVRLRTTKTKGCLSRMTALTMVFKLCQSASNEVASPGRLAPDRRHHSRRQIQGRRKANRTRRLKPASPTFDNSSSIGGRPGVACATRRRRAAARRERILGGTYCSSDARTVAAPARARQPARRTNGPMTRVRPSRFAALALWRNQASHQSRRQ